MQGKTAFFYETGQNNHQFYELGMHKTPQKEYFLRGLSRYWHLFDDPDLWAPKPTNQTRIHHILQ